jgi:hypothetical protein
MDYSDWRFCHTDGVEEMLVAKLSGEILRFAVLGAEERLRQISAEAQAIYQRFPQLRSRSRSGGGSAVVRGGNEGVSSGVDEGARGRKGAGGRSGRRRRTMSAEARKRISDAQKARWARQKAQKTGAGAGSARSSKKK